MANFSPALYSFGTFLVQERCVDLLNVDAPVLYRLDGVGDLQELARALFLVGEGPLSG
jgi:hypothetical protein